MKKISLIACSALLLASYANFLAATEQPVHSQPSFEVKKPRSLPAPLLSLASDYYLRPDGSRIQLLRKQGLFVVEADSNSAKLQENIKTGIDAEVEFVVGHRLGSKQVFRVSARPVGSDFATKKRSGGSKQPGASTALSVFKSADSSVTRVSPIFANANGQGDIALLPKLTIKLHANQPAGVVARLERVYGFQLERKLRLPGNVYSVELNQKSITAEQQFALVRNIAADPAVMWAEPQFISKPYKTQYVPADPLFADQWHLRNRGFRGSQCDTDCDADNAWDIENANGVGAVSGANTVIAIIDDGVQLDHPDLADNIWENDGESCVPGTSNANRCSNGVDDDSNGFVDDFRGWDFVVDSTTNPNLQNANFDWRRHVYHRGG